jgi:hypothetical protein
MKNRSLNPFMAMALTLAIFVASCAMEDEKIDKDKATDNGASGGGDDAASGDDASEGDDADGGDDATALPVDYIDVKAPDNWNPDAQLTPVHIHLTWTKDPSRSIAVQWKTDYNKRTGYTPKAWFMRAADAQVDGSVITMRYNADYTVVGGGIVYQETLSGQAMSEDVYSEWTAYIENLEPNTLYYYRVGTWTSFDESSEEFTGANLSPVYSFKTAKAKGSHDPFTFMSAGDSRGGYEGIQENIQRLKDMKADFWLFNGDMTDLGRQEEWGSWFEAMSPLLNYTVLMPVQGNHEIVAEIYYLQFALPAVDGLEEKYSEYAWSFDYQNAHFIGLNSNSESIIEAQKPWLEADLAAASQDSQIEWIFVMYHHPAYSACTKHGSDDRVQKYWVPLFDKYGVDISFSGHDHDYERSKPIRGNSVASDGKGVIYIVTGGFYSDGYSNGQDWWTEVSVHGDKHNYTFIQVDGNKLTFTAYSGDGKEVLDEFALTK